MEGIYLQIGLLVLGGLMTLIPIIASVAVKYAKTKFENKYILEALSLLEGVLKEKMKSTGDKIVKEMKERSKDGKLTFDEAKEARDAVIKDTKEEVKKFAKAQLDAAEKKIENLDDILEKKLEKLLEERTEKEDK
jgi:polyhydroxyalkanoate synthesis regulator phasin